jgi:hypothetical protein
MKLLSKYAFILVMFFSVAIMGCDDSNEPDDPNGPTGPTKPDPVSYWEKMPNAPIPVAPSNTNYRCVNVSEKTGHIWLAGGGNVYCYNGTTWIDKGSPRSGYRPMYLTIAPNGDVYVKGYSYDLYKLPNGENTWQLVFSVPTDGGGQITSFLINKDSAVYIARERRFYYPTGVNTWAEAHNNEPGNYGGLGSIINSLAMTPNGTIYAAPDLGGNGLVYRTTNFGINWVATNNFPTSVLGTNGLTVIDNNIIFASTTGGLMKTTDGGINWTKVLDHNGIIYTPKTGHIFGLGRGLSATTGLNGALIFKSTDLGVTWEEITNLFFVESKFVSEASNMVFDNTGQIYITRRDGVYSYVGKYK